MTEGIRDGGHPDDAPYPRDSDGTATADHRNNTRPTDGWQPIETAPGADSDMEKVLVCGGRWTVPEIVHADGEWWRMRAAQGSPAVPTHWMPLPNPPKAIEG
jgi:hypothetical protein